MLRGPFLPTLAFCVAAAAATAQTPAPPVILAGDHDYAQTRQTFDDGATIDATQGVWRLSNSANASPGPGHGCRVGDLPTNPYPLIIDGARGGQLLGGRVMGEVPQDSPRGDTYCNSAGLVVQSPEFTVRGIRIDHAWDGIRTKPPQGSWVRLEQVWVDGTRDDCIENDNLSSLEVSDSLLDGCFMGVSLDPGRCKEPCGKAPPSRFLFDRVLLRLQPYPQATREGGMETKSGVFLKTSAPTRAAIEITNSVFAFEDIPARLYPRMREGWDKIARCADNRLLYLGGESLPDGFPDPPACFTVVTGAAARAEWRRARGDWIARVFAQPAPAL